MSKSRSIEIYCRRKLPTNCLSVFGFIVGLALKGLNWNKIRLSCELGPFLIKLYVFRHEIGGIYEI